MIIDIAKEFARYPFGRYRTDGPYSGQQFREQFLEPALTGSTDSVTVVLDGAIGLGSSFLEEAFGGLVRQGFPKAELQKRLIVSSDRDRTLAIEVAGYIADAEAPTRLARA